MIGSSGNVNSGSYHKHEVTKCLHESRAAKAGAGGRMAAGIKASSSQLRQEQKDFSLQGLFMDGLRNLFTKASGFWRGLGEEGRAVQEGNERKEGNQTGAAAAEKAGEKRDIVPPAEDAAAVLATAVIKPNEEKRETVTETERRVGNVEGAVNGGLKREQGGIRGFFQKFKEAAAKAGQFLKRKKKAELRLVKNDADFHIGDNSFLLDSYNREGKYSTLAKDRSLEGSFRAKG